MMIITGSEYKDTYYSTMYDANVGMVIEKEDTLSDGTKIFATEGIADIKPDDDPVRALLWYTEDLKFIKGELI